jgi:signal transduction histidine kinase
LAVLPALIPIVMIARISGLIVWLLTLMMPGGALAEDTRVRSILFMDQSDLRGTFYHDAFKGLQDSINANVRSHVTLYRESLDLSRFSGAAYEKNLRHYVRDKYRDRPIGVIVAIGLPMLALVQRWRDELWPGIPVVFGLVNEADFVQADVSPDTTGGLVRLRLADSIKSARSVVPDLESIVIVGDDWERLTVLRHWREELPAAAAGLAVTELVGLPMDEVRKRVATLPDRSAIIYSAVYSDGQGGYYPPSVALGFIAETANRPIIVPSETYLEHGIGGFVLQPAAVGVDIAGRVVRIMNGEAASSIPVTLTNAVKPIFNWREMRRWKVKEADLPPGSEIRFRDASIWEKYRWQSASVAAALIAQAIMISILLHERRRRGNAEFEARQRLSELAHVHRQAMVGQLSSSIAHELNQPLGAILTNAETAEFILDSDTPDLIELRQILADIRQDDLRASQVIVHMRSLVKRTPFELKEVDANGMMREGFQLLSAQAAVQKVAIYLDACPDPLRVRGDPIQLQQVVVNLIVNGMDAMSGMPVGRMITGRTAIDGERALISIADSGPGIPTEKLGKIFDPFSTKEQGMGIGLSIAKSIVHAHKGRIWAENQSEGGAVFRISLPLSR